MYLCITFARAEVQRQNGLQQRVGVEREVKLRSYFWLQGSFYPLFLRRCHPLYQSIWDLHTHINKFKRAHIVVQKRLKHTWSCSDFLGKYDLENKQNHWKYLQIRHCIRYKLDTRDDNPLNEYFSKEIYSASRFYNMSKQLNEYGRRIWNAALKMMNGWG